VTQDPTGLHIPSQAPYAVFEERRCAKVKLMLDNGSTYMRLMVPVQAFEAREAGWLNHRQAVNEKGGVFL
jgi:hypothetical protein